MTGDDAREFFDACIAEAMERGHYPEVEGGGHTIPGRRTPSSRGAAVGAQNNDIDSARMIFDFFKRAVSGR